MQVELKVNDQSIRVVSNENPIKVSDGQKHTIEVVIIGEKTTLVVDKQQAFMDILFWLKTTISNEDLFLAGLPSHVPFNGISAYTG